MSGQTQIVKSFYNDKGLDQRSSDLIRDPRYASGVVNADYRKTGDLNKRKGNQSKIKDTGGAGS